MAVLAVAVFVAAGFGLGSTKFEARDACAAGQPNHVALVIDFGNVASVPGAPQGIVARCVPFDSSDTGLTILNRYAVETGLPLRSERGLICAIASYPAQGCGERSGSHYLYWSYWSGDAAGWSYQQAGPASRRVSSDIVEGWRFVDGASPTAGAGLDPPRNLPNGPSYQARSTCIPAPPQPVATTSPPNPGSAPGPVATVGGTGTLPAGPQAPSATAAPTGSATPSRPEASTTTVAGSDDPPSKSSQKSGRRFHTNESATLLTNSQVKLAATDHNSGSNTGAIVGSVLAVIAVGALLVFGVVRSRQRARS